MIVFNALYITAAIIYLCMGYVTITNDSKSRTNRILMCICFIMFFWSVLCTATNSAPNAYTAVAFRRYAVFTWSFLYSTFLLFYLVLTKKLVRFKAGRLALFKRLLIYLLLYIPAFISIYLYYFYKPLGTKDIVKTSLGWAYGSFKGNGWLWDNFLIIYYITYTSICVLLVLTWGIQSKLRREKKQAAIIVVTLVISIIAASLTDVVLPFLGINLLPPAAVITSLVHIWGIWYSMKKYRLMNLNPENIFLDFLNMISEGLITLNNEGNIIRTNRGAMMLLGYNQNSELLGKPVDVIFPKDFDKSDMNNVKCMELELITKKGQRLPVILHSLTLSDNLGDVLGTLISFQDLTEIKEAHGELQKAYDNIELKVMERTNELKDEIKARIIKEEKIKQLAYYDALTNLPNRRLLQEHLEHAIVDAERNNSLFGVLFIDIDFFKMVNDSLGHADGDELLKQVSYRLINDTDKVDLIARVGGDEFVLILRSIENRGEAKEISERILDNFQAPFDINGQELIITASIGIAIYPFDGIDGETLVKNADTAMYKAKNTGKNKSEIYVTA